MPTWRQKFARLGRFLLGTSEDGAEWLRMFCTFFQLGVKDLLTVIVDADACPRACLAILRRSKKRWGFRLLTIASVDHHIDHADHITVGKGADAADLAVVNHTRPGDIVITQDWGLAALVLAKGAAALSPSGRIFTEQNIDFLLEERFLKARHRRAGGRTKGPAARTGELDRRFKRSFLKLLRQSGLAQEWEE